MFFRDVNRRLEGHDRQQQARDAELAARRNIEDDENSSNQDNSSNGPPATSMANNLFDFPANPAAAQALPEVDLNDIIKSCEEAKQGNQVNTGKVLNDILGMMVHMYSKQSENEKTIKKVDSNTNTNIRKLPIPPQGVSELQNAQHFLKEIRAQGVDIYRDAVKAVRKESAKHNPALGPNLGTVLVELKSEDIRGKIMKTKKNLENHAAIPVRNLIIKNAMLPSEMKAQNTNMGILRMITGGDDYFIAGNGSIRQKTQNPN